MFNLPVSNAVSSPGAVVSQWQSNVKPTESDSALVQHTQVLHQVLHASKKHDPVGDDGDDEEWQNSTIGVRGSTCTASTRTAAGGYSGDSAGQREPCVGKER